MCLSGDIKLNEDVNEICSMKTIGAFGFTKPTLPNTKMGFKGCHFNQTLWWVGWKQRTSSLKYARPMIFYYVCLAGVMHYEYTPWTSNSTGSKNVSNIY